MFELTLRIRDLVEIFFFVVLSVSIYCLFVLTVPIFRDPHGLIVMSELSTLSRSGIVKDLIFGSAVLSSLSGVLMMGWAPVLTPGVMANLWATSYFFIWVDTVFALSVESRSLQFLTSLLIGLVFIYLFFFVIHCLGFEPVTDILKDGWKVKLLLYSIWGWMSFYFGLSLLLAYNSLNYGDFRWPLSAGCICVCFLNYVLSLFLQKAMGRNIDRFSHIGRVCFGVWSLLLAISWAAQKWYL